MLLDEEGVFVASSDYVKALPDSISKWFPRPLISLGTDGFGRSESRVALRDFFEVDAKHIVLAVLYAVLRRDALDIERWNLLHPSEEPKVPYITKMLLDEEGVFVASSDYVKALPDSISKWV